MRTATNVLNEENWKAKVWITERVNENQVIIVVTIRQHRIVSSFLHIVTLYSNLVISFPRRFEVSSLVGHLMRFMMRSAECTWYNTKCNQVRVYFDFFAK